MSATVGWSLIATGAVLMIAGLAMVWASLARPARQRARAHRMAAGLPGALTCTSFGAGVIAAAEWLILSQTRPGAAWLAVLAVPAFLAAATVTRVIVIARTVHVRQRARAIRWNRGCQR
jgi:hypothetical protein